ncbi:hypothetical protein KGM_212917B, partial [Danaus plexippus plexippus]
SEGWESVGTLQQKPPLLLENCLSYDEMKLSAMLYVSGFTYCINDGKRNNSGVVDEDGVEEEAVIIGLIGPRFQRRCRMDNEDILITEEQNCIENGYGEEVTPTASNSAKYMWRKMWSEFYQKKWMNSRSGRRNTKYTSYDPGLSLGGQCVSTVTENVAFKCLRRKIGGNIMLRVICYLSKIIIICPIKGGVNIQLENREPSSKLSGEHAGKLLVMTYPWDGNAHPGNEFWFGSLKTSGDPAAACSTQVSELHNAHINTTLRGDTVRVAAEGGVRPLREYCLTHTRQLKKLGSSGDPAAACSTQVSELHNAYINPAVAGHNLRVAGRRGIKPLAEYCLALTSE